MNILVSLLTIGLSGFFGVLFGSFLARRLKVTELRKKMYFDLLGKIAILNATDSSTLNPPVFTFDEIKNQLSVLGSRKSIKIFNKIDYHHLHTCQNEFMNFLNMVRKELGVGRCSISELKKLVSK